MIYKNISLRWRNFWEASGWPACIGGAALAGAIKAAEPSPSLFRTEQHCSGLWAHHLCRKKRAFPSSNVIYSAFPSVTLLSLQISGDALVTRVDTRHKSSFVLLRIFAQMLFIFYPWRPPDSRWELDRVPGRHPSPSQHALVQGAALEHACLWTVWGNWSGWRESPRSREDLRSPHRGAEARDHEGPLMS